MVGLTANVGQHTEVDGCSLASHACHLDRWRASVAWATANAAANWMTDAAAGQNRRSRVPVRSRVRGATDFGKVDAPPDAAMHDLRHPDRQSWYSRGPPTVAG